MRRQSGNLETYTLPWQKQGTPYTIVGPAPDPQSDARSTRRRVAGKSEWELMLQSLRKLRAQKTKLDVIHASNLSPVRAAG